ncbi:hypothetical protein EBU95_19750, partial [bacterium]|nr:hypothetical protein [bacterium]
TYKKNNFLVVTSNVLYISNPIFEKGSDERFERNCTTKICAEEGSMAYPFPSLSKAIHYLRDKKEEMLTKRYSIVFLTAGDYRETMQDPSLTIIIPKCVFYLGCSYGKVDVGFLKIASMTGDGDTLELENIICPRIENEDKTLLSLQINKSIIKSFFLEECAFSITISNETVIGTVQIHNTQSSGNFGNLYIDNSHIKQFTEENKPQKTFSNNFLTITIGKDFQLSISITNSKMTIPSFNQIFATQYDSSTFHYTKTNVSRVERSSIYYLYNKSYLEKITTNNDCIHPYEEVVLYTELNDDCKRYYKKINCTYRLEKTPLPNTILSNPIEDGKNLVIGLYKGNSNITTWKECLQYTIFSLRNYLFLSFQDNTIIQTKLENIHMTTNGTLMIKNANGTIKENYLHNGCHYVCTNPDILRTNSFISSIAEGHANTTGQISNIMYNIGSLHIPHIPHIPDDNISDTFVTIKSSEATTTILKFYETNLHGNSHKSNSSQLKTIKTENEVITSFRLHNDATLNYSSTNENNKKGTYRINNADNSLCAVSMNQNIINNLTLRGSSPSYDGVLSSTANINNSIMEALIFANVYFTSFGSRFGKDLFSNSTLTPQRVHNSLYADGIKAICDLQNTQAEFISSKLSTGLSEDYLITLSGHENDIRFINSSLQHNNPDGNEVIFCKEKEGQNRIDINCCGMMMKNNQKPFIHLTKNSIASITHTNFVRNNKESCPIPFIDGYGQVLVDPISSKVPAMVDKTIKLSSNYTSLKS